MAQQAGDTRQRILDAAEGMIREAGYNGFSTRDVASAVGVKAASVHYHFPTKADIGVAVTERYSERFVETLGPPTRFETNAEVFEFYADLFRMALRRDKKLCLCAVLGAESAGLPDPVSRATRGFFRRNLDWLREAYGGDDAAERRALLSLSALEGAMMISRALDDPPAFDRTVEALAGSLGSA